jgi:hypothetical protein
MEPGGSGKHVATLFGDERTEIVDWHHASEHICTVAKAVHGNDAPERRASARTALDQLWQTGPQTVLEWFVAAPPVSTAVEASAKHLVQQRVKRARSRWSDLGARAILDLRCHLLSGRSLDRVA